jgi:hypothetical protein
MLLSEYIFFKNVPKSKLDSSEGNQTSIIVAYILLLHSRPLLNTHMLDLCPFNQVFYLPKFLKPLRLCESKVIFDFVPAAKKHKFLILAFLINPPSTVIDKWRRIGP